MMILLAPRATVVPEPDQRLEVLPDPSESYHFGTKPSILSKYLFICSMRGNNMV